MIDTLRNLHTVVKMVDEISDGLLSVLTGSVTTGSKFDDIYMQLAVTVLEMTTLDPDEPEADEIMNDFLNTDDIDDFYCKWERYFEQKNATDTE